MAANVTVAMYPNFGEIKIRILQIETNSCKQMLKHNTILQGYLGFQILC
jgi:hypothetical protein